MKAFWVLLKTETKLAIRDGNMLFFGVLFPVAVMLLLGFISPPEARAAALAGTASIGICAAGLMGVPLTFASYRHGKVLRRLKATPASPLVLFLAVSALQAAFALASAIAVYLVARFGFGVGIAGPAHRVAFAIVLSLASSFGLGYLVASLAPDTQKANLACTVLYFPALFLSGATVPSRVLPGAVRAVAEAFPLTQGIKLLEAAIVGSPWGAEPVRVVALAAVTVISCGVSLTFFRWD